VTVYSLLPHVNAALNATSVALLLSGWHAIRSKRRVLHHRLMLGAVGTSALFLVSYLVHHARVGSVRYQGSGWSRGLYISILLSHTVLAAVALPLVLIALRHAIRGDFPAHRHIAHITLPIWVYVSLTGVIVYLMLYRLPVP